MPKVVGIDLGTTNSAIAVMEGPRPVAIPNSEGGRVTPSMVAFTRTGEIIVGGQARRQAAINPENTVYSIKRFMGRRFSEVTAEARLVAYQVVEGPAGDARVRIPQKARDYTPQELSAMILQKLKRDAEAYLGQPVNQAVITVPAYFNDAQRQATRDAGTIAGLNVMRIINEPSAASLAYGVEKTGPHHTLVFDLGGGTYDVSLLRAGAGAIEVLATNGDTHLGGDDYDERIIEAVAAEFQQAQGIDLLRIPQALQRLREAAERAKTELSMVLEADIDLPFIAATSEGPRHLQARLTRARFEQLTADLTQRLRPPLERVLSDAGLAAHQVHQVIMVGGATRMPAVSDLVHSLLGEQQVHRGLNPDEVVAIGAALQAGVLSGAVASIVLRDVTPLSLGVETLGGVMTVLIPRNTPIPAHRALTFSTASDGQTAAEIHVLQGEREFAADNLPLGRFRLDGIAPAPRGTPLLDVTFDVDANGILSVAARDRDTGHARQITAAASTNLSQADIERMMAEAREHAAADRRRREAIEARNEADGAILFAERTLRQFGARLAPDEQQSIVFEVERLRRAMQAGDAAAIRTAIGSLQQALQRLARRADAGELRPQPGAEREAIVVAGGERR